MFNVQRFTQAILGLAILLCLPWPLRGAPADETPVRPNIIFIMGDDHTSQAWGCYGSRLAPFAKTPNIDRLAREGARLTNCFCTNSICVPSRASILTGQHSHVNGVKTLREALDPGTDHVAKRLQRAGYLTALVAAVQADQADVGLATDGDADRIGAVDASGNFVDPHHIFALTLRYLVEKRGWTGSVVKTVSTTLMIDRLAAKYNLPLHETPVGFNHIGELMLNEDVLMGGEESGGLSIKGHIPEGDGVLMGLLLLEVMSEANASLQELVADLQATVGPTCYARRDLQLSHPVAKQEMVERLTDDAPAHLIQQTVRQVDTRDGVKYRLADDSWLLIRPSGTEPVLRVYAEGPDEAAVDGLIQAGRELAGIE